MSGIIEVSQREVLEFHRVLEAWLRGAIPHTAAEASRMGDAFGPRCVLVAPGGVVEEKAVLMARLFQAHGSKPDMEITIDQFAPVWTREDVALVSYIEWRKSGGQTTGRYASVLFQAAPQAPAGVHWLHIHETWMAAHGPR
ncbi:hypothetical protein MYSTI_02416 [Myxococcus stipitatus DSM 14675]|uniref:Sucrose-phosphatase C-terminal domain-containing protein n=1 Tax=Myxococcus stipitatus (strain DSM 14675 / JCM 12634 / Mx s8) TaxID=1278073 RepID=L7U816_MYXSD|nr:DUF4440 domain-containing protein [Myxococcus stipitatus]AGC43732.1 hypothetical protein MYSTI_02416 [Myxococcus stipitatus DSM 14675]